MSRVWVLLLFHFWAVNPLRCILCRLYASFFYLFYITVVRLLSSFCVFISLCASFVVLALVFLPEFYSAAYRTPFLSWPVDEDVFLVLCVLGGCLLVVSSVLDFVCVLVSCVFIISLFCVSSLYLPGDNVFFCWLLSCVYPSVCFPCIFSPNLSNFWLDEEIIAFF